MDPVRVPSNPAASFPLPPRLEGLRRLAYNLHWAWHPRTRGLFRPIDRTAWARYRNPIPVISGPTDWSRLLDDPRASGSGLHALHGFSHKPTEFLGLKCVGLHLGLCVSILHGHHFRDVLRFCEIGCQCKASLSVLLGEADGPILDDLEFQMSSDFLECLCSRYPWLASWRPYTDHTQLAPARHSSWPIRGSAESSQRGSGSWVTPRLDRPSSSADLSR